MTRVFAGIGSNVEPERNLQLAVRELAARYGLLRLSPVYRNPAVGFDGPDFLNLVAGFETDETPLQLVSEFERIHDLAGRVRDSEAFSSRPLDIDLLLYGERVATEPPLPRADVLDYAFVLKPLSDLEPTLCHPVTGKTYAEHWAGFAADTASLTRVPVDFCGDR